MRTLVIGCGNPLRGDDGAGPEVVRRLGGRDLPASVRIVDAGTGGIDAALAMRDATRVIVVDACRGAGPPGEVVEAAIDALPAAAAVPPAADLHGCRWAEAIALVRALDPAWNAGVTVFLVGGASFDPGIGLSPEVERAVEEVCTRVGVLLGAGGPRETRTCGGDDVPGGAGKG